MQDKFSGRVARAGYKYPQQHFPPKVQQVIHMKGGMVQTKYIFYYKNTAAFILHQKEYCIVEYNQGCCYPQLIARRQSLVRIPVRWNNCDNCKLRQIRGKQGRRMTIVAFVRLLR